jgi:uncharacterized lipoprotein YddW (UPF0748 family)
LLTVKQQFLAFLCSLVIASALTADTVQAQPKAPVNPVVPAPRGEFRGVWIATVGNIDWPSRPGLSTDQQKSEMIALLDRAKQIGLNAVVFQVRPGADALYASPLEPWSEFITGTMGKGPEPFYDPLQFAVEESHKRGLELHAWFNPYRARYANAKAPAALNHISVTRPDLAKPYGKYVWMDPGEPEVQDRTLAVILDVVKRYDVDAVHMDDYFYPYIERDANDKPIPFPDDPSWNRYVAAGGTLPRDDWRRENVNTLVRRINESVHAAKPWVKVGVSPFGIWIPGNPPQIKGGNMYDELYCDSKKWLQEGWVDYLAPQLYWKIEQTPQSFPVLLNWWVDQNAKNRHIWPGLFTNQVMPSGSGKPGAFPLEEIVFQIKTTRGFANAGGTIHFSARALLATPHEKTPLGDLLANGVYSEPALVPASPWMPGNNPPNVAPVLSRSGQIITWKAGKATNPSGSPAWLWAVQTRTGKTWKTAAILTASQMRFDTPVDAEAIAVTPVDRTGNLGPVSSLTLFTPPAPKNN